MIYQYKEDQHNFINTYHISVAVARKKAEDGYRIDKIILILWK